MARRLLTRDDAFQALQSGLQAQCGHAWKEARCEWYPQYREIPVWILVYTGANLRTVSATFCKIAAPLVELLEPDNLNVTYLAADGVRGYRLCAFDGMPSDEELDILDADNAWQETNLQANRTSFKHGWVFQSQTSDKNKP